MAYDSERVVTGPLMRIGSVVLLHVALIWVMAAGLTPPMFHPDPGPFIVRFLDAPKEIPVIKLPPVQDKVAPPVVPMPDILIDRSSGSGAITVTRDTSLSPKALARGNRQPEYPASAKRLKQQGTVIMLLLVGIDGRVSDVKVETSSGFAVLDEAASQEALRSWRYAPGSRAGVLQPLWVRAQVKFSCGINGCG
jgi:protein TonB